MSLGEMKNNGLFQEKSVIIAPYILCGFAFSIGIQIGGIGAHYKRKSDLSQLGILSFNRRYISLFIYSANCRNVN